jgi:pseudouridine kinase
MTENDLTGPNAEQKVLVIGAAGLDMIGRLKDSPLSDAYKAGKSNPANIRVSFGGVARNVAENLSRLGQPVSLITAVGKDHLGQQLLTHAAACGVDTRACVISNNHQTASYLAVMEPDGSRYLALEDMSVLEELTPDVIRENKALIAEADMIFIDANLPPPTLKVVFQLAHKARVPVCADTTSSLMAPRLLPYLDQIYLLTANNVEASVLCQDDPTVTDRATALQAAKRLLNQGVDLAVVTLAEFGVVFAASEVTGHVPAMRTRIIDPTGAGDALTATVIFGLLNDIPIDESVRLGVTAASLILRYRGTVLPELSLEKLYAELVL